MLLAAIIFSRYIDIVCIPCYTVASKLDDNLQNIKNSINTGSGVLAE